MAKVFRKVPGIHYKGALLNTKGSFHDHSVSEIRNKVESSPEFTSGKIRRKSNVRWI